MLELTLKVEGVLGTSIETSLVHAACLARKLDVEIVQLVNCNGVTWDVRQGSTAAGTSNATGAVYTWSERGGIIEQTRARPK